MPPFNLMIARVFSGPARPLTLGGALVAALVGCSRGDNGASPIVLSTTLVATIDPRPVYSAVVAVTSTPDPRGQIRYFFAETPRWELDLTNASASDIEILRVETVIVSASNVVFWRDVRVPLFSNGAGFIRPGSRETLAYGGLLEGQMGQEPAKLTALVFWRGSSGVEHSLAATEVLRRVF